MRIGVVIIDDEQRAIDSLKIQLNNIKGQVDLLGEAKSVEEGFDLINKAKPELVFLDIEMNDGTGFDLLRKFEEIEFTVIFTTAYDHYAIQAIKFSALDYLLKPIDPSELDVALDKAIHQNDGKIESDQIQIFLRNMDTRLPQEKKLAIRDTRGIKFFGLDEISHLSAEGSYTKIILTSGKKIVSAKVLKYYDDLLKDNQFFRVHRSSMVNLNHVAEYEYKYGGSVIMTSGEQVFVSDEKKKELIERLES